MKYTLLSLLLLLSTALYSHTTRADDSPMEESMDKIGDAAKPLGKGLASPDPAQKDTYLAWVKTIKTEAVKCLDFVPEKIAGMPAEQQAPILASYKKEMEKFIADVEVLQKAIEGDQWTEAGKAYQQLRDDMKTGHRDFRKSKK